MTVGTATVLRRHQPINSSCETQLPWWKQLAAIRKDFLGFLSRCSLEGGDVFCIRPTPFTKIFVVNSAELTQEVLVQRKNEFIKSSQTRMMVGKFLGKGLVLAEGDHHAGQRRQMLPHFSPKAVGEFSDVIERNVEEFFSRCSHSPVFDIEAEMTRLTLTGILKFILGPTVSTNLSFDEFAHAKSFAAFAEAIGGRFKSLPLPDWIPTSQNRRERRALDDIDRSIRQLVEESRIHGDQSSNVMTELILRLDKHEITFSDLRDQIVTLLFAGHETVAKSLSWTFDLLSRHPGVQEKIFYEISELDPHTRISPRILPKLKYTQNVVKESLRLYPPVWVFDRSPIEEIVLGGERIRPRDVVYLSTYLLHRQERYFPNPLQFDPLRFQETSSEGIQPYLPFGSGHRGCIGQSLAFVEILITVVKVMERYRIESLDPNPPLASPGATLGFKVPVYKRLTPR